MWMLRLVFIDFIFKQVWLIFYFFILKLNLQKKNCLQCSKTLQTSCNDVHSSGKDEVGTSKR